MDTILAAEPIPDGIPLCSGLPRIYTYVTLKAVKGLVLRARVNTAINSTLDAISRGCRSLCGGDP